jgi:hypothetical protein
MGGLPPPLLAMSCDEAPGLTHEKPTGCPVHTFGHVMTCEACGIIRQALGRRIIDVRRRRQASEPVSAADLAFLEEHG